MTPKRLLALVSIAEACTWAILLFGMLVKYGFGGTGLIVTFGGSLHGAAFIAYLFVGLIVGVNQRFTWLQFVLGGLAAIPPFATLLFDWWAARRGLLEGDWRTVKVLFGAPTELDDDDEPPFDAWDAQQRAADAQAVQRVLDASTTGSDARGATGDATSVSASASTSTSEMSADARETHSGPVTITEVPEHSPSVHAAPAHAHPADARHAARGTRPAPLRWLDPLVRWSVAHPYTISATLVLVFALILTRSLAG